MTEHLPKPAVDTNRPPVFPHSTIWEESGDDPITFEKLAEQREDFRIWADIAVMLPLSIPYFSDEASRRLEGTLDIDKSARKCLMDRAQLIAGWYLKPEQNQIMRQDLRSVRSQMAALAEQAERLASILGRIAPKTSAMLSFMHRVEPDQLTPSDIDTSAIHNLVDDLARLARRAVEDIPARPGRQPQKVRDSALALTIQAVEEGMGEPVRSSRGTSENPAPHFTNASGRFVRDFFLELGVKDEHLLVQAFERLRRAEKL